MTSKKLTASVVADSITEAGARLTTFELTFPRYLLAELNTHRDFSRNSASSRARSLQQTISEVAQDPYVPITFYSEIKGMSGGDPLGDAADERAHLTWLKARDEAVKHARWLMNIGVHKSQVNRILEPFMWHTAVVTATEWENFFSQRLAKLDDGRPAADPVFYRLAYQMKEALGFSVPVETPMGSWHTPYVRAEDWKLIQEQYPRHAPYALAQQISVARCAGVSYLNQNAQRELSKDLSLFERLRTASPPHWSPFEHVAQPLPDQHDWRYNLRGWESLRYVLSAKPQVN